MPEIMVFTAVIAVTVTLGTAMIRQVSIAARPKPEPDPALFNLIEATPIGTPCTVAWEN